MSFDRALGRLLGRLQTAAVREESSDSLNRTAIEVGRATVALLKRTTPRAEPGYHRPPAAPHVADGWSMEVSPLGARGILVRIRNRSPRANRPIGKSSVLAFLEYGTAGGRIIRAKRAPLLLFRWKRFGGKWFAFKQVVRGRTPAFGMVSKGRAYARSRLRERLGLRATEVVVT